MTARLRSLPGAAWRRVRRARRRSQVLLAVAAVGVLAGAGAATAAGGQAQITTSVQRIEVTDGPHDDQHVRLDTTLFRPAGSGRLPAVILAHGFGGSKSDLGSQARRLAGHGYAVLTFSARGFGRSSGRIELDSPDYEVKDVRGLIDWLAGRRDIVLDQPGDPRVGITGGSYGGALALLAAAYDPRVDAIVPTITWNDLAGTFFRQSSGSGDDGVFAQAWAGLFFGNQARPGQPCGRMSRAVCAAYQDAARTGRPSARTIALLKHSSPAGVLNRIHAPTLLIQGETDSLFGLDQADANAAGIAAAGTLVHLAWYAGGHDAGNSLGETGRLRDLTTNWFDHWLRHKGNIASDKFTFSRTDSSTQLPTTTVYKTGKYPGLDSTPGRISLHGPAQPISNPPGGDPKAVSSIPGAGLLSSRLVSDVPGQFAQFLSAPLSRKLPVVGAGRIRISVTSTTGSATLFLKLYDIDADGDRELPGGAAAPVHIDGLVPGRARTVTVQLPAIVHDFAADHRLGLVVSATDQAYDGPRDQRTYRVSTVGSLSTPSVDAHVMDGPSATWPWAVAALALLVAGVAAIALSGRTRRSAHDANSEVPVVIEKLRKSYGEHLTAVADASFRVERGQVLGLLGPNGAGKTTTLRILLGLISPTAGQIRLFGRPVTAGDPVLERVGALVEGPGLLPHLSGMDNLRLYWRATGRPEGDAQLAEVLRIAGLGDAVDRRVRTYSHGMKQRLAIAQAMLGLPDLLVLDEPTNGLDPPQIRDLRGVLQDYAAGGRTVVVSSHLLGEVEQTCTHVVVMDRGRIAAAGTVAEIIGTGDTLAIETDDPERSLQVLAAVPGVQDAAREGAEIVVTLAGAGPGQVTAALVAAGLDVRKVAPRRRLEDAFVTLVGEPS